MLCLNHTGQCRQDIKLEVQISHIANCIKTRGKMKIQIFNNLGKVIIEGEYKSLRDCVDKNKRYLRHADLSHAYLYGADLRHADLYGANLRHADLSHADLHDADFRSADFRHANLSHTYLYGADLRHADLSHAYLYGANLRHADLRHADFRSADLRHAYLRHANLQDTDLRHAYLHHANLQGTDLKIHFIVGSSHAVQFLDNNIKIGCEYHSLAYWLVMYDVIGKENNYTDEQIKEYHEYIKSCKEL